MKIIHLTKKMKILIAIVVLLIGISIIIIPCPTFQNDSLHLPKYIKSVSPGPKTKISFSCYNLKNFAMTVSGSSRGAYQIGGIIVDMRPMFLPEWVFATYSQETTAFSNSVTLFVDGRAMDKTWDWQAGGGVSEIHPDGTETNLDLPGWYRFGSNPLLLPGDHTATVLIETSSGETLEYEWKFTIVLP